MTKRKKNPPYKVGDNCFFINARNKIRYGEVKSIHETEASGVHYQIVDTLDYRFNTVEHKYCADSDKLLKGVKRSVKK